jgi:hypothetical protein
VEAPVSSAATVQEPSAPATISAPTSRTLPIARA